tara:strand:- start:323 stop:1006 length:684 start_codon:yes stop_codon:yes gene_type:complete
MFRIYKSFILIFFLFLPFATNAHVQHYDNLKRIEFDIFRNNKHIGQHIFSFKKNGNQLEVESEINFIIKKFGVVLYKYHVKGTEYFENGKLVKFNSKTDQNGKKKYVNIKLEDEKLVIDGSSFKGKVPTNYLLGTWWNHSLVESEAQISAVSGRIIKQKVTFLGKENLIIGDKSYNTLHFNFSSVDKKLTKDKKLNTDVWYDEDTLNWVKASFKKKGNWEYRLLLIE